MDTKTMLEAEARAAAAAYSRAQLELDRIDRRPVEPGGKNPIVRFRYRFSIGGTTYQYAAIRCGNLWYTTGPRAPKGYTWDELISWLDDSQCKPRLRVCRVDVDLDDNNYFGGA